MNQNETIQHMKTRFAHIVNHLASLGKIFPNKDLIDKVLRCLSEEWQPKVTAIAELRDLTNMSLATLFGKLQEHELELMRLNKHKEMIKRGKEQHSKPHHLLFKKKVTEKNRMKQKKMIFQFLRKEIQQVYKEQRKSKKNKFQSKEKRR